MHHTRLETSREKSQYKKVLCIHHLLASISIPFQLIFPYNTSR